MWRHSQTTPITNVKNKKPFFHSTFFANSMKIFPCISLSVCLSLSFQNWGQFKLEICPSSMSSFIWQCPIFFLSFDNVAIVAKSFDNVSFVVESFSLTTFITCLYFALCYVRAVSQSNNLVIESNLKSCIATYCFYLRYFALQSVSDRSFITLVIF